MLTILEWLLILVLLGIASMVIGILLLKLWLQPYNAVCKCKTRLDGKTALVTGANSGIGLETARDLARRGARVIIAARNEKKSIAAVEDVIRTTGNPRVEYRVLDLSKFSSIRKFAEDFNRSFDQLHILVNNAGAGGVPYSLTEDGIETMMQTNYIGPFMLTNLLLDKLGTSAPSRIVIVSSFAHYFNLFDPKDLVGHKRLKIVEPYTRYANTKLCNIMWAKALAKRVPEGVTVNVLEPGTVNTGIYDRIPGLLSVIFSSALRLLFKTVEQGAVTTIHVCIAPELEGVSGKYFSECKLAKVCKKARDDELIEMVWDKTMLLVKGK